MRAFTALLALTLPAHAWEFTPVPVCTLTHETAEVAVSVTYDPRQPQAWTLSATGAGWAASPVFAIRFDGPRGLTISTPLHILSADGRTLTVSDTGFGNVLDGLEFNGTATLLAGPQAVAVPLDGAAPGVQALRACAEGGVA